MSNAPMLLNAIRDQLAATAKLVEMLAASLDVQEPAPTPAFDHSTWAKVEPFTYVSPDGLAKLLDLDEMGVAE